jgi:hypothetical protein
MEANVASDPKANGAVMHCPKCRQELSSQAQMCTKCGHALNGAVFPPIGKSLEPSAASGAPPIGKVSPEILNKAREQFNEEEFVAGLSEIEESGGYALQDFIGELEQEAKRRE